VGFEPTIPSFADEVLALLDALGIDRVALVANSLGGGAALDVCLAALARVPALVLVGVGRAGWEYLEGCAARGPRCRPQSRPATWTGPSS